MFIIAVIGAKATSRGCLGRLMPPHTLDGESQCSWGPETGPACATIIGTYLYEVPFFLAPEQP
jgi:hypothetical protein